MNKLYLKSSAFADNAYGIEDLFEAKQLRRTDNLTKIVLFAAAKTLAEASISLTEEKEDIGLIIATGRGPVKQTCNFMDSIIDGGDILASPLAFSSSVHNSLETSVSMLLNFRGPCLTLSQGGATFESAVNTAKNWLLSKRCKYVLLGAADEIHPVICKEYGHKIYSKDHAAFFLLSFEETRSEFDFDSADKDNYNPSAQAYALAKKYIPFVSKKDMERIIPDFIKTFLAGRKKDVISVFDKLSAKEMLARAGKKEKEELFAGLKLLCCIDDAKISGGTAIEEICYEAFGKNNRINFFTSGSTGEPKSCIHTLEMVREEAEGLSFLFKDIKRAVATVPAHHSYGFIFGLQIPKLLNLNVVSKAPLPFLEWDKILKEGDLLITFPLFMKYLAEMDFKFPKGVTVLTSTAPCPDSLIEDMYARGAQRIIEIYGSSETGAIGFRENAGAPFFLLPFWDYHESGGLISEVSRKNSPLRCELPDVARSKGERVFSVVERKDRAVKIAGINVYPLKVEEILKKHNDVKDAVVRAGGERLKAFIVLRDGTDLKSAKKRIYNYLRSALTVHEMPKNITFGDKLPLTPFGKKADW